MIAALVVIIAMLATALVAVVGLVLHAVGKEADRRIDRDATMMRAIIARGATETMAPGAEYRALRDLEKTAALGVVRANGPLVGAGIAGMDEMEEARERIKTRAFNDGLVDEHGDDIVPTGFA